MDYNSANEAKASFDDAYNSPTPHAYYAEMDRLGYEIGEQAKPYFLAAIEHLEASNSDGLKPRVLDLGCSYGVGSSLVKHEFTYAELSDFFQHQTPREFERCVAQTRDLLATHDAHPNVSYLGLDCSAPALHFGEEAGLLAGGIARNFEAGETANQTERSLIRNCNLLFSTGAIGYVGEKTLSVILEQLGKAYPENAAPLVVVTILRMFDPTPIANCFESFRMKFAKVPDARLRQRQFADSTEQDETLALLKRRGVNSDGWESDGILYSDLYVAAHPSDFDAFFAKLNNVKA